MGLKEYAFNGSTYQFDEGQAPKGAKPVESKAGKPAANKARTPSAKTGKPAANKTAPAAATEPKSSVEDATDPSASE